MVHNTSENSSNIFCFILQTVKTSNSVVKPEVGEKEVDICRQIKLADEHLGVRVKHGGVVVV